MARSYGSDDTVEITTDSDGNEGLSKQFRDKNNNPAPMLRYSKKINGTYYAVVACPDSKYKKLWVVSAYISKNKDSQVTQEYDVETPYSTSKASLASPTAVATNVPQPAQVVKRSDSDIAQIESVISEASRDKEEMYSDFDGQEAPKNVQQEIKCSTRFNEEYMDAAIARNEKLGNVDAGLLNQAAKDRAAVAKLMRQLQADKKIGLPEDILGNTFFADSSYGGSEENTTICPRSLASEAFMDAVSDYIGRPLTVAEQIYISQDLQGRTATPECLYCYVATDRKAYREFLGRYIQQRDLVGEDSILPPRGSPASLVEWFIVRHCTNSPNIV